MPIVGGTYVNPGWANDTTPAIDEVELNAISDTLECVPVGNGGTGATSVAGARSALGLGNTSGALPVPNGGTGMTDVTMEDISVSPYIAILFRWGRVFWLYFRVDKSSSSDLEIQISGLSAGIRPVYPVLSPTSTASAGVYGTAELISNTVIISGAAGTHHCSFMWMNYQY